MPYRSFVVFTALAIASAAATGACSQQGEGEPCNPNADDCGSNLVCTPIPTDNDGYRCCPPQGSSTSTAVCSQNSTGVNGSNPPPSDASTDQGSGQEASTPSESGAPEGSTSTEAGPEAAAEASTDAPSTTPGDGGDAGPAEASAGDAADGAAD